jgi:ubiquinone/menaquinone biosynthesis C-methylase UbiE
MGHKLNRFNWIAPFYDKLVRIVFGNMLKNSQLVFLSHIKSTDSVLILGGGAGDLLVNLLAIHPQLNVYYLEASSQMIHLARKKIPSSAKAVFVHGTHENILRSEFDFVITNFVLDLFSETVLVEVIGSISAKTKKSAKWIVTDFENSSKRSHKFLLSMMYFFFRATKSIDASYLPDWRSPLQAKGFETVAEKSFCNGFIKSTLLVRN